jgi:hypothetical protein
VFPSTTPAPSRPQVSGCKPLTVPFVPTGMNAGVCTGTVRRGQDAGPRLAVSGDDLDGDGRAYNPLPPFRISIASPNE